MSEKNNPEQKKTSSFSTATSFSKAGINKKKKEEKGPDGSLGCFYFETPCPNMPFNDKALSEEYAKLVADEKSGELAKKNPMNPWVTASVVAKGEVGKKILQEAFVMKTDEYGALEVPADQEAFARAVYILLYNRFGPRKVRIHQKSLPFSKPPKVGVELRDFQNESRGITTEQAEQLANAG